MNNFRTSAIIAALSIVVPLQTAAHGSTAGFNDQQLSYVGPGGPEKKKPKPVVNAPSGPLPSIEPSNVGTNGDTQPATSGGDELNLDGKEKNARAGNIGEALFNMMFGTARESTPNNASVRRKPPTLKRID